MDSRPALKQGTGGLNRFAHAHRFSSLLQFRIGLTSISTVKVIAPLLAATRFSSPNPHILAWEPNFVVAFHSLEVSRLQHYYSNIDRGARDMLHRTTDPGSDQIADLLEVHPKTRKIPPFLYRIAVLWACILAGLFFALIAYGTTPGPSSSPPTESPLGPASGELQTSATTDWEVVMAVHPKCPCTVASLNELNRLLTKVDDDVTCRFLVYHPAETEPNWIDGKINSRLSQFPRSIIQPDEAGEVAFEMGMQTSGAVVVFDPHGKTRFHGGITVSRNHEGDNLGVRSISMLIQGQTPPLSTTPVFGCRL